VVQATIPFEAKPVIITVVGHQKYLLCETHGLQQLAFVRWQRAKASKSAVVKLVFVIPFCSDKNWPQGVKLLSRLRLRPV
jgi:hypothetical protein